jgi:hypothetical protein
MELELPNDGIALDAAWYFLWKCGPRVWRIAIHVLTPNYESAVSIFNRLCLPVNGKCGLVSAA